MSILEKKLGINIKELIRFKDLIILMAKEKLELTYRQTVLGFLWYFITPLLTAIVYSIIFSRFAQIHTNEIPPILFYLSGTILWNYFSNTFIHTSNILNEKAHLMSKVYFPRIIPAISVLLVNTSNLLSQLIIFILFYTIAIYQGFVKPTMLIFTVPLYIALIATIAFGSGLFVASIAVKYKDFMPISHFLVRILMFLTPVLYPTSIIPSKYQYISRLNPLVGAFEGCRNGLFLSNTPSISSVLYVIFIAIVFLLFGLSRYSKTTKNFIDII